MGIVNAPVFPDPVTAPPTTSLPSNATGMVAAWIGVGVLKLIVVRALRMGRERFMVRKDLWTSEDAASESKKAALRSISACVSGSVSSDEEEASDMWPSSEWASSSASSSSSPSSEVASRSSSESSSSSSLESPSESGSSDSSGSSASLFLLFACDDNFRLAMMSSTEMGSCWMS